MIVRNKIFLSHVPRLHLMVCWDTMEFKCGLGCRMRGAVVREEQCESIDLIRNRR